MTNKEAIEMMKAKLECMTREVSGRDAECNSHKYCEECDLCYAQGNMGEQKEWLRMGIEALENQKIGHWVLKRVSPTKLYGENIKEYECSECYRKIRCTESQLIDYPYCHCGAKMEGE